MKEKLQRNFVSEIDEFLEKTREQLPLSASQKKEIAKHDKLFKARDNATDGDSTDLPWEEF